MSVVWICCLLLIPSLGQAHEVVGEGAAVETVALVTMPTAGILPRGSLLLRANIFPEGTFTAECLASPVPRLMLGLAFGGRNLIGMGSPEWQRFPGVFLRFRLYEEGTAVPAFALGLQTQGWGGYSRDEGRFTILAAGLYLAASKSYRWWLGELAWHGMLSYPLEPPPSARHGNWAIGLEHSLGRLGRLAIEYNALWGDIRRERRVGAFTIGLLVGFEQRGAAGIELVDIFPPSSSLHPWARALTAVWYFR